MGLFDIFRSSDINSLLLKAREMEDSVIIDVRDPDEFRQGHIPGAINVPVDNIEIIEKHINKKDTPIFSYCLSGMRSRRAVSSLTSMGYTDVNNIGGINRYKGKIERG
ncbi:MAG: rhodanese-like domain-containing protein [Clostridiales bacterium]|nr:rhodanese-like domain-containing protein [Clostridiales bacterium]